MEAVPSLLPPAPAPAAARRRETVAAAEPPATPSDRRSPKPPRSRPPRPRRAVRVVAELPASPEAEGREQAYGSRTRRQWTARVLVAGGAVAAAGMVVLVARGCPACRACRSSSTTYPGEYPLPAGCRPGFPWWAWQHFFNVFLMVLIIRSGLQVRTEKRPTAFWSPPQQQAQDQPEPVVPPVARHPLDRQRRDLHRAAVRDRAVGEDRPDAAGRCSRTRSARACSTCRWTGRPRTAGSTTTRCSSSPTSRRCSSPRRSRSITGVRMSGIWPKNAKTLNRIYPVEWARAVHFPVMLYFVPFIIVHVILVFATGALRNLNHMYAAGCRQLDRVLDLRRRHRHHGGRVGRRAAARARAHRAAVRQGERPLGRNSHVQRRSR